MQDNHPYRSTVIKLVAKRARGNQTLSQLAWVCALVAVVCYLWRKYAYWDYGIYNATALVLLIAAWFAVGCGWLLSMRALLLNAAGRPAWAWFCHTALLLCLWLM